MTETRRVVPRLALVATALSLLADATRAEIAGTGGFEMGVDASVTTTVSGMLSFTTGTQRVLGLDVDLATNVGDMSYAGTAQLDAAGPRATLELTAGPASELSFHATGVAACAAVGCLESNTTLGATLDLIDDPMSVLPAAARYTFDGSIYMSALVQDGVFGINAFVPVPTVAGPDQVTRSGPDTFFDSVQGIPRGFEATVRYPNVTGGGTTTFLGFSLLPGAIPAGYALVPELSVFIDVVTAGVVFTGEPTVCISDGDADADGFVDGVGLAVAELRVLHASPGQPFADVTGAPSPGFVCATVPSLSWFVLARSIPGGATTTTTLPGASCGEPIACIDGVLAGPLCGDEAVTPRLQAFVERKLGAAKAALGSAASSKAKRADKLVARARKQLTKIGAKADAFVEKKKQPITPACRDAIRAALARIGAAVDS